MAILFHLSGLFGMLFFNRALFVQLTPLNLSLSAVLLCWTQKNKNFAFAFFVLLAMGIGFFVEVIGVNTGSLFGHYRYGTVLGYQWNNVPLLIGVNWFMVMYCCGISVHSLLTMATGKLIKTTLSPPPVILKTLSVVVDGAMLALLFDWLIEPVAIKLGFWKWQGDGSIPLYNYICWFVISAGLLTAFHFLKFNKENKFAINLFLIQIMFFLLLRTFLQ